MACDSSSEGEFNGGPGGLHYRSPTPRQIRLRERLMHEGAVVDEYGNLIYDKSKVETKLPFEDLGPSDFPLHYYEHVIRYRGGLLHDRGPGAVTHDNVQDTSSGSLDYRDFQNLSSYRSIRYPEHRQCERKSFRQCEPVSTGDYEHQLSRQCELMWLKEINPRSSSNVRQRDVCKKCGQDGHTGRLSQMIVCARCKAVGCMYSM